MQCKARLGLVISQAGLSGRNARGWWHLFCIQLLELLKKRFGGVGYLVVTGKGADPEALDAFQQAVDPFDLERVGTRMQLALSGGAGEPASYYGAFNLEIDSNMIEGGDLISRDLGFEFRYFALRKLHFMLRARALVALPGGYGTLDELFETLCLVQTGKRDPLPIVISASIRRP